MTVVVAIGLAVLYGVVLLVSGVMDSARMRRDIGSPSSVAVDIELTKDEDVR